MKWETMPLEKLAVRQGGSVNPAKFPDETFELYSIPAYDVGSAEICEGKDIGSSKKCVQPNDVLLSRIVPHIRRSWVVGGSKGFRQIASSEWIQFRSADVYPQYLRHFLVSDPFHCRFMQTVSGVGGSLLRARAKEVYKISIPLPPLTEQQRIARILDAADALRVKRRQALSLLETFLQATFLDLFGDPVLNPKGWEVQAIPDIVVGKYGIKAGPFGSSLKKEEYVTSGYRVYGQEQVIAGRFDIGNYYIDENKFQKLKSCEVKEGDILISLVGSYGKVLIVPKGIEPGIINPRLLKITPNQDKLTSLYMAKLIQSKAIQYKLASMSHGGTMGILNAGLLKQLSIPLPPLDLQRRFAAMVAAVERQKAAMRAHLTELEQLFGALQQRAFNGELGTGNGERGTGNGELGTGNSERGTRNEEREKRACIGI